MSQGKWRQMGHFPLVALHPTTSTTSPIPQHPCMTIQAMSTKILVNLCMSHAPGTASCARFCLLVKRLGPQGRCFISILPGLYCPIVRASWSQSPQQLSQTQAITEQTTKYLRLSPNGSRRCLERSCFHYSKDTHPAAKVVASSSW